MAVIVSACCPLVKLSRQPPGLVMSPLYNPVRPRKQDHLSLVFIYYQFYTEKSCSLIPGRRVEIIVKSCLFTKCKKPPLLYSAKTALIVNFFYRSPNLFSIWEKLVFNHFINTGNMANFNFNNINS